MRGIAFAAAHGIGEVRGDTLQFQITYSDGPFRDTFVYHGPRQGWHFRLESGDGHGGWKLFADYDVAPAAPGHGSP